MSTQATNLDELRARFEASRSFEDDDDWLPSAKSSISTNSSRRSTLTNSNSTSNITKKLPAKNLTIKKLAASAIKRKSVDLEASKKKWEPTANWEPPSYQEAAFVPTQVGNYGVGVMDPSGTWMDGWAFDAYGMPVKIGGGAVHEEMEDLQLEVLRKKILARSVKPSGQAATRAEE